MIIGLTGGFAAGKGAVAEFLKEKGFAYHSLSDVLRARLREQGVEVCRDSLMKLGNELRAKHGPSYLAGEIKKFFSGRDIVDSIRSPYEVEELRKNDGFFLIALTAPPQVRFERAMQRGRVENVTTLEEFIEKEKRENVSSPENQQIDACVEMADYHIENNTTLEQLYAKVEEVLNEKT